MLKYPRTYHLPSSPGVGAGDRVLADCSCFEGRDIVASVKLDGENTTMHSGGVHARSLGGRHRPSQDWVRALWARVGPDIPAGWRVCGENMYARHTIAYPALPSYFIAFSVWDGADTCLGWDETVEWLGMLGLERVPVTYEGPWDEAAVVGSLPAEWGGGATEGLVVRLRKAFHHSRFHQSVAKWVRAGFRPGEHFGSFERNGLAELNLE